MKIAITGHRPNKLGFDYDLKSDLIKNIREKIENIVDRYKPDYLISGMALGIDTLFALIALYKEVPLIAAVPFKGQESVWAPKSQTLYNSILKQADVEIISEGGYTPEKMQIRNIWMVDNCDLLIAVWDGTSGGTANCVKYAQKMNKEIIFINPNDCK